jgi:integrase
LGPAITVAEAIEEYCAARENREAKNRGVAGLKKDARSRLWRHVLHEIKNVDPKGGPLSDGKTLTGLAKKRLANLTAEELSSWRRSLNMAPASARRTANDFKAALNVAARRYSSRLPYRFRDIVKDGFAVEVVETPVAREAQILPDADVRALIEAAWSVDTKGEWEGDLARIVLVLAATGARFSQVQRLTVADVQFAEKRLIIPASRKGRTDKPRKPTPVRVGEDILAALRPATAGRKGHETLLFRPRWQQVSQIKWEKYERAAWRSAAELTRPWAAIVAKARLASTTVPYALRHSSIVRGLRAGLPVRLVAALHDTSSAMIESHYAAYIADAMGEIAARAIVPLTTVPATVISIQRPVG